MSADAMQADFGSEDLYVGVDIGGTFTDLVVMDAAGNVWSEKSSTVPGRLQDGVLDALHTFATERKLGLRELLSRVRAFGHGTTQATNALVQRDGARTGLITTRGFGDTIFIQRLEGFTAGVPDELLGFYSRRRAPTPVVPRSLVREVPERVDQAGEVLLALDESRAREAIAELLERDIEALAICLLWSFRNPCHEQRLCELATELAPELVVSLSSEVAPVLGEYERTASTVLNAYVAPRVRSYLETLERELRELGFTGTFRVLGSSGGVMSANEAAARPVLLLGSGPTGGVIGSRHLAHALGDRNVITTDMGGTSFDVGLIVDSRATVAAITEVGQYHVAASMVQVRAIGAGGGSIASVRDGQLRVGPESAGADPGPVCYGRGGTLVTVTDANVVLGLIAPDRFLGGRMRLDRDAAIIALRTQVAEPLGLSVQEAAAGVRRVVGAQMAGALRELTIGRGHDPRDFVIYAYGGAGPLHCADYGHELGVRRIVVPATAMVHCAYGALASDVLFSAERSLLLRGAAGGETPWEGIDPRLVQDAYATLAEGCLRRLRAEGVDEQDVELVRSADVRYRRQTNELIVVYHPRDEDPQQPLQALVERFEAAYEDAYGKGAGYREAGIEITTLRVQALGRTPKPQIGERLQSVSPAPPALRDVYDPATGELVATPVWDWLGLPTGHEVPGPAVIEHPSTTVYVARGQRSALDPHGNLVLETQA